MAIQELSPAQEAGFKLAVQTLREIVWTDLPDTLTTTQRSEALQVVGDIVNVIHNYPHVILELTTHA